MVKIPLATSDWRRASAEEPVIKVQNRYFETNPTNQETGASLIARPGFKFFDELPDTVNEVLSNYYQEGLFDNSFFSLTDGAVYRRNSLADFDIINSSFNTSSTSTNRGAFTGAIGDVPSYFFMAGTDTLDVYSDSSFATGTLTRSGTIANGDVVQIGGIYYQFTSGSVDAGTPAGTSANPWLVALGLGTTLTILWHAINLTGTPGTDYSSATTKHPSVNADDLTSTTLLVYASPAGSSGNSISTTETSAALSWGGATLSGGGVSSATRSFGIPLPDSIQAIRAIVTFFSYVIIIPNATSQESIGRFYWIQPGELHVDELDFATAESSPDNLLSARVVNDRLWLMGANTVEVWYATGDANTPFLQAQGNTFEIGCIEGTDVVVKDSLFVVGTDNNLYQFGGSSYSVVSDNSISDRLRAFAAKEFVPGVENRYRSWSFDLDGHSFYVLNLGMDSTIVYDLSTKQFAVWSTLNKDALVQHAGFFFNDIYGSEGNKTIVADIFSGTFWEIDEDTPFDDGSDGAILPIQCIVTGGLPMRFRETIPCNEVYLTASTGNAALGDVVFLVDEDGTFLVDEDGFFLIEGSLLFQYSGELVIGVLLETSDDNGNTWVDQGTLDIVEGDFAQELVWRSLGRVMQPGRLFRLTDYVSVTRIDDLDMQ